MDTDLLEWEEAKSEYIKEDAAQTLVRGERQLCEDMSRRTRTENGKARAHRVHQSPFPCPADCFG
jgi:hypothetical protein